jgi:malate synthase
MKIHIRDEERRASVFRLCPSHMMVKDRVRAENTGRKRRGLNLGLWQGFEEYFL